MFFSLTDDNKKKSLFSVASEKKDLIYRGILVLIFILNKYLIINVIYII